MNLKRHIGFHGSASDLAALAIVCGKDFGLPVDPDKTNERLVRYYVSEGVMDRPDRVGRDADYGFRHLLQLLTARRLMQAGMSLSVIAAHNSAATTRSLEEGLARPVPTAAELLVNSFQGRRDRGSSAPIPAAAVAAVHPSSRPGKPAPSSFSLVDVLDEVKQFRDAWMREMSAVRSMRKEVEDLRAGLQGTASVAHQALHEVKRLADVSALASMRHEEERADADESLARAIEQLRAGQEQIVSMLQALLERLPEPEEASSPGTSTPPGARVDTEPPDRAGDPSRNP